MDTIQNNAVASVHYTGTLPDTGEVFDSSEDETLGLPRRPPTNDSGFEEECSVRRSASVERSRLEPERAYGQREKPTSQPSPCSTLRRRSRSAARDWNDLGR